MLVRGPKDSYIELFMSLLKDQETPSEYDFWAAVWTVGAVVGRSCFIDRPRAPIHFNWYIIICAESGMTRKSTVINFAKEMIDGCLPNPGLLIQNKTTPEKLWDIMSAQSGIHGRSHVVLNISELVTFFGRQGYTLDMPAMLTDLYDCPVKREGGGTLNYGALPLLNPFITFIAGSTPSWLARAINPDIIEGGFTSRTIFISSEYRKKLIFWPDNLQQPNFEAAKEYLCAIRDHAAKLGHIEPDEEAKAFLEKWYRTRPYSAETYLRSFESREDSHILRLAGTIALSKLSSRIGLSEIELALYVVSRAKKSGRSIFRETVFDLKLTNGLDKIREILLKRGLNGIKSWELFVQCKRQISPSEFSGIMEVLTDIGAVRQYIVPPPKKQGRPARYFVATTKIVNPHCWREIQIRSGMQSTAEAVLPDEPTLEPPSTDSPALTDHISLRKLSHSDQSLSPSMNLDIDYTIPDQDR